MYYLFFFSCLSDAKLSDWYNMVKVKGELDFTLGECRVALLAEAHGAVGEPQGSLGKQQHLCVQAKLRRHRVADLQTDTNQHRTASKKRCGTS